MNAKPITKYSPRVLLVSIAFQFGASAAMAQTISVFEYLEQALVKVVGQATVFNLANYDYVDGSSLLGVYLAQGRSQSFTMNFEAGVEYLVLGGADNDVVDLDLELVSMSGTVLQNDSQTDAVPYLNFQPSTTAKRTIRLKNFQSYQPGFCAMVILRKRRGGYFSLNQIADALDNLMVLARTASQFSFQFAQGNFCLFGGRASQGGSSGLFDVQLREGSYAMVGAGSNNIQDVDLSVVRQYQRNRTRGVVLAKDDDRDNAPMCLFNARWNENYYLQCINYASRGGGSGFVFAVLLEPGV
jgi:hypothetical protein